MAAKVVRHITKKWGFGVSKNSKPVSSSASVSSTASTASSDSSIASRECFPKTRRASAVASEQIPVFMLPRKDDLSMIPEDQEIRQGFSVIVERKPDSIRSDRSFSGLVSISDLDDQPGLMEETATTGVHCRFFSWLKKC